MRYLPSVHILFTFLTFGTVRPCVVCVGLDGAAFQSRLPANKMTQLESDFFPDIASGSQSAIMEFLFIRNKLLQLWVLDPTVEFTPERAQAAVNLPHPGTIRALQANLFLFSRSVCITVPAFTMAASAIEGFRCNLDGGSSCPVAYKRNFQPVPYSCL